MCGCCSVFNLLCCACNVNIDYYIRCVCSNVFKDFKSNTHSIQVRVQVYVCLVGDFNLPELPYELHSGKWLYSKYSNFGNILMQYGLKQLVHSSTRHDSILDLVFSNKNTICSDVIVSDPFSSSDHASLIFNIFMDTADVDYKSTCFRDFRSGDYDSFNIYLNSIA